MIKKMKILLFVISSVVCFGVSANQTADEKAIQAANKTVDEALANTTSMYNLVAAAGDYAYSDAIALISPMADLITNPVWLAFKRINNAEKRNNYLKLLLNLTSGLIDNRERASKADNMALQDALDANMSSEDFVLALGSPFSSDELKAQLTTLVKNFAKPVTKKQDTKSIVSLVLLGLVKAQTPDKDVFARMADVVNRRLDDDEVVNIINASGVSVQSFQFQSDGSVPSVSSVNFFDATNFDVDKKRYINGFSYENSWASLRSMIEKVCGHAVYRNYTDSIDLVSVFNKSVNGVQALRTELLARLVAPFTIDEVALCIDRLSSIDPFKGLDVTRFVNRVRLIRHLISNNLLKQTAAAAKTIRLRIQFVLQSKINDQNTAEASTSVANVRKEVQNLLDVIGSEAFNDQIPDSGTIVALQWKNPATGLNQYVSAGYSQERKAWLLNATNTDYIDDTALFYVISNGDKIGFQCVYTTGANKEAPGFIAQDSVAASGASGILKFAAMANNPARATAPSVEYLKANKSVQFFMEGTRDSASFKSGSFVSGVTQQSGYWSVSPEGVIRTFNPGTMSPSGAVVDGSLVAGPWETFSLVMVDQFFIDLAKIRNAAEDSAKIDFWRNSLKQVAIDQSNLGVAKRLAVVSEMLKFIQSKDFRAEDLGNLAQKFSDALSFASSMLATALAKEDSLRMTLSKLRAEFDIPVQKKTDGSVAALPVGLPLDGQAVVLFVPQLAGSSSGRYLEVVQESLDPENPSYVLRASALDPVSPEAQFKASVFRDFVSFESIAYPGNFFQVGVPDDNYKNLVKEARALRTRVGLNSLAKDSLGLTTGFWDVANRTARLQLIDNGNTGSEYFRCVANRAFLRVDSDGFVRTYDVTKVADATPAAIVGKDATSIPSLATPFQVIPVKMLYTKLGDLQKQTEDLGRVQGYKALIAQIETNDDIYVLFDEVGGYLDSKRIDSKTWTKFDSNSALKNAVLDLLKQLRTSFKDALKTKALKNRLGDIEEKFAIAPVFSSQSLLKDGDVIALGWKDDTGVTRYVSLRSTDFTELKDRIGGTVPEELLNFAGKKITQLEAGDLSPIDGKTHFKVLIRKNTNLLTLQSMMNQSNMQAVSDGSLIDIEDRYSSLTPVSKTAFDKAKNDVLGVGIMGMNFDNDVSDQRIIEEFTAVAGETSISFKSVATGGFVSVSPSNRRLVTIDPITMHKSGMERAGVLVPTAREQFIIIPVSDYIVRLGAILNEADVTARFAKYLYYVAGAVTDADRKVFIDSIEQEISQITATAEKWSVFLNDPSNADARASLAAIVNQLEQDQSYQKTFKADIDRLSAKLDAGYVGTGVGGVPAKGSIMVLRTMGANPKYVRVVPSQFDGSVYVLAAGLDGGDDLFDPSCQFITDAKKGMLGLRSTLVPNTYVKSVVVDSAAGATWIAAKRNAQTEISLTGKTFASLSQSDDQTFKLEVVDPIAGTVQLINTATGGYLSWVTGTGLPSEQQPAAVPTDSKETQSVNFVVSSRLRTVDPLTLKPFGKKTVVVRNTNSAANEDIGGTTFTMTVFDEYYKMLLAARSEKNYIARFAVYARILPLVKSSEELRIFLAELSKMVDVARNDKDSQVWKDFSSEEVRSKFNNLLTLVQDNFGVMLFDSAKKPTELGKVLIFLQNFESNEQVISYNDRFLGLKNYLDFLLTPTCVDDFMMNLTALINDRTDAVVIKPATSSSPAALSFDLITTVTTWVSEGVFYNKIINQTKKKEAVSALMEQANLPVTYAEFIKYLDTRWIGGKDRFTANEKTYVLSLLDRVVAVPWLALASAQDYDLAQAKDLLFRARANQLRDDADAVAKVNALLPRLVYPLISGTAFMVIVNDVMRALRSVKDQNSAAFTEARDVFIRKISLWKTRVILKGAGQLDLFNFATLLNSMLNDPTIAPKISGNLRPVLSDVVGELSAQGISFTISNGADTGVDSYGSVDSPAASTAPKPSVGLVSSSGIGI
ncbi:hypothetical protein FJ366_00610 [Candidatus Dependentiae bacterium]|nr:hypothetical protein [Candidatus Dependentiae bacterium]